MPKSFFRALLFLIIITPAFEANAQKYLVFDKPGITKRVRFYAGEKINFKSVTTKTLVQDEIVEINDPFILLDEMGLIHVDSITHFAIGNQNGFAKFRSALSGILITAGLGYFIIDSFNNGINENKVFDEKTIYASVPMIAFGILIKPWSKRKYKIGNNKRLFIIDMDSGLEKK